MKKIFISILVFISVQSFGQVPSGYKLYGERKNNDATIDSFFVKNFIEDSVFNKQLSFVALPVTVYERLSLETPGFFGDYILCADNKYRNIPNYTDAGDYTPTLFNTTNVAASTAYQCSWFRVRNKVFVFGLVDIDVTLGAATELRMSLPIASNLTAGSDLTGTAASNAAAGLSIGIAAHPSTDRASFLFTATSLTNNTYAFTFSYTVK